MPKTYYNKRFLRIIIRTVIAISLAILILIIVLFLGLSNYIPDEDDGTKSLDIPWLISDPVSSPENEE